MKYGYLEDQPFYEPNISAPLSHYNDKELRVLRHGDDVEHRFQINLRGIIDLLSEHLYSGPEVFIRELLQNAVDAIRARTLQQSDWQGEISIEIHARDDKPPALIFTDNGIGLTEEEVHKFLATIGESSKRPKERGKRTDFIGQFGIGILSCFVVSDEITVVSRSLTPASQAVEWRARPDGNYTLKTLDRDLEPGTQVFLVGKQEHREFFQPERVRELVRHFGGLLPYPIRVTSGKSSINVNESGIPWRQEFRGEKQRLAALLEFGREMFDTNFFDAIPLKASSGDVDGVAFILPYPAQVGGKRTHRVYLKNMLLSEDADNLLPDWAFFVKAVVNANDLRPTASRESFYEDAKLARAREQLGDALRDYLVRTAQNDERKFSKFLDLHSTAIKAISIEDDECFRVFIDWLPFETSLGKTTFGEFRKENEVIRYVPSVDQFRQVQSVAAAQGISVINAGYVYDADLLAKASAIFPDLQAEVVDSAGIVQAFEDLSAEEQDAVHDFLNIADSVLRPFKCNTEIKRFKPSDLPVLYSTSADGRFFRSLEQSKEVANPLWSGVLDSLSHSQRHVANYASLCFNFANSLIQRLARIQDRGLVQRSVQMLYVQSLLLGHHPLAGKEIKLLNDSMMSMIEWGVEARGRMEE